MKVLIYTEYFFPVSGGVQTNVYELACGLSEWHRAHSDDPELEVTIVTQTRETTPKDDSWPFRLVRKPTFTKLFNLVRSADVIHVAGPAMLPMLFSIILRRPMIVEHHGYQSICPNGILLLGTDRTVCPGHFMAGRYWNCVRCNAKDMGWTGSLRGLLLMFPRRLLSKMVPVNVAISNHVAGRLVLPRTRTILYGIRDPGYGRLPQNGNSVQIGYVGRLVQEKGLPLVLAAAQRLKDDGFAFHLRFVGDGPVRKQLEAETERLGMSNQVSFTGDLTGPELERAVRPIQIALMPSLCEETAGLSAIEQMMRGGLVIASDIGGLSEIVGDGGLKFAPGNAEALYLKLRGVLESPSLVSSLGEHARKRAVQLFSRDTMIRAHVSVYREASNS